ncbi:hypothetical protein MMC14_003906 [Varicellaria rhodocarpa]|nr:hypothetical protein [Varicellaria rhodocarpa]
MTSAQSLQDKYEIRPDAQGLTHDTTDSSHESAADVDYEPHPERSAPISSENQRIVQAITSLYSGSASKTDMEVYAEEAIYDDPWSYCDTRYKIAGQWYGIPKVMASSRTLKTEIISSSHTQIMYKQQQEYTPRVLHVGKPVNSLVTLTLEKGKVRYHKDMWNEKDYSHKGLGKVMKTLNGDYLTKITRPPKEL